MAKASESGFNPRHDPYGYRKDAGSVKDMEAFAKLHDAKHPEDKMKSKTRLGAGSYGSVFPTEKGIVKVDRGAHEAHLLKKLPERLKKHSVIPKNVKTGSVRVPPEWKNEYGRDPKAKRSKLTTISREDLKNIHGPMAGHLDDLEHHVNTVLSQGEDGGGRDINSVSGHFRRRALRNVIGKWHQRAQADPNLSAEHKKALKTYTGGLARLIHHGIVPHDLYSKNIGMRPDGSLVMRDLGVYKVLDDSKRKHKDMFHSKRKVVPNVNKLKGLQKK